MYFGFGLTAMALRANGCHHRLHIDVGLGVIFVVKRLINTLTPRNHIHFHSCSPHGTCMNFTQMPRRKKWIYDSLNIPIWESGTVYRRWFISILYELADCVQQKDRTSLVCLCADVRPFHVPFRLPRSTIFRKRHWTCDAYNSWSISHCSLFSFFGSIRMFLFFVLCFKQFTITAAFVSNKRNIQWARVSVCRSEVVAYICTLKYRLNKSYRVYRVVFIEFQLGKKNARYNWNFVEYELIQYAYAGSYIIVR